MIRADILLIQEKLSHYQYLDGDLYNQKTGQKLKKYQYKIIPSHYWNVKGRRMDKHFVENYFNKKASKGVQCSDCGSNSCYCRTWHYCNKRWYETSGLRWYETCQPKIFGV